jgi:divalent metal cation (Fe/Co/Zn/Cd) transporter
LALTGFRLVKKSSDALLDTEDSALITRLVSIVNRVRPVGVINLHGLRSIRSGRVTHVDIHVIVPEFFEVGDAHDLVDKFAGDLIREAKIEGEFHTHIDPCRRKYCSVCAVEPCPVRQSAFKVAPIINELTATDPDEMGVEI